MKRRQRLLSQRVKMNESAVRCHFILAIITEFGAGWLEMAVLRSVIPVKIVA
jgi:hypothetical protein